MTATHRITNKETGESLTGAISVGGVEEIWWKFSIRLNGTTQKNVFRLSEWDIEEVELRGHE